MNKHIKNLPPKKREGYVTYEDWHLQLLLTVFGMTIVIYFIALYSLTYIYANFVPSSLTEYHEQTELK